jgi:branched-subunit amino acid ABC-type transport system permease component
LTTLAGAVAGGVFGLFVMSRKIANQGALALTIISLAAMMLLLGVATSVLDVPTEIQPPGAFGAGTVNIWGVEITRDQFFDCVCVVVLIVILAAMSRPGCGAGSSCTGSAPRSMSPPERSPPSAGR